MFHLKTLTLRGNSEYVNKLLKYFNKNRNYFYKKFSSDAETQNQAEEENKEEDDDDDDNDGDDDGEEEAVNEEGRKTS